MAQIAELFALLKVCEGEYENGQPRFKEWIISSGWDFKDKRNKWHVSEYGSIMYGVETDGLLKDCFGIRISPYSGVVSITYFNKIGNVTLPYIICTEFKLVINE